MDESRRPEVRTRRAALAAGSAAVVTVGVAACGSGDDGSTDTETTLPSTGPPAGTTVAVSDVPVGGGIILKDAKVVVTQPAAGEFKAFSAVCTHQFCVVSGVTDTINCACHGSVYALTDGSVVKGPATRPLPGMTATVDGDSLTIT